jgi:hypothetical protein
MMTGMSRLAMITVWTFGFGIRLWMPITPIPPLCSRSKRMARGLSQTASLDAVFVPGGDPGTPGLNTFSLSLKNKPRASINSTQGPNVGVLRSFNKEWFDEFIALLNQEHPSWLSGIVFGPQVRVICRFCANSCPHNTPFGIIPISPIPGNASTTVPIGMSPTLSLKRENASIRVPGMKLPFPQTPALHQWLHNLFRGL